jgi:predicted ATP-grasp superfamily ATP-dependent carboligase
VLEGIRQASEGGPVVLFPERDAHVDFVLRRWEGLAEVSAIPLPSDPAVTNALRDKVGLAEIAFHAGVQVPRTVELSSADDLADVELPFPFILKPVESERYAAAFRQKVVLVETRREAEVAWEQAANAGFALFAQELVPGSADRIMSLFTYIGRSGEPLGAVVGRKVRQGPPGFGSSTVFAVEPDEDVYETGMRLLRSVGYRGLAHVELVRDPRDRVLKLLEVNTRLPVWAGLALSTRYDLGPVMYADLCGEDPVPLPEFRERVAWTFLAKDLVTGARLLRGGKLGLRAFARPYAEPHVPAVRALSDPLPAAALLRWGVSRALKKITARQAS